MARIKFDTSAHWYATNEGDPKPQHDADLRIARKQGLYTSISTILKEEFKNDFLDNWKVEQVVKAACVTPRQPHDTDETYGQRIYELSLGKGKNAADFGTKLHKMIEGYPNEPKDQEMVPWFNFFREWYLENISEVIAQETILVDHDIGLAGTCDMIAVGKGKLQGLVLPDWKSQDVKLDDKQRKKPAFYDSWPRQLAFYGATWAKQAKTFPLGMPTCVSVIFDSNEPSPPFVKVWTEEEIKSAYEDTLIAAYRWHKRKKYWPQRNGRFKVGFSIPVL